MPSKKAVASKGMKGIILILGTAVTAYQVEPSNEMVSFVEALRAKRERSVVEKALLGPLVRLENSSLDIG